MIKCKVTLTEQEREQLTSTIRKEPILFNNKATIMFVELHRKQVFIPRAQPGQTGPGSIYMPDGKNTKLGFFSRP